MTVDRDLLADYLGGALDGTPEHARIARLITTDPEWAAAASTLTAALTAVEADLAALPPPTMPAEVRDRLDAVLARGGIDVPAPRSAPTRSAALPSGPAGGPGAPGRSRPGSTRPGTRARRRRLLQWSGGLTTAAALAAFAAFGYPQLIGQTSADSGGVTQPAEVTTQAATGPPEADAPEAVSVPPVLVASGIDYQPGQLPAEPPLAVIRTDERVETVPERPGDSAAPADPQMLHGAATAPPELTRLWADPAQRAACVAAVQEALAPTPMTAQAMDFAYFQGAPAVVIWLTDPAGESTVVVAGPDCGTAEAGADERFRS